MAKRKQPRRQGGNARPAWAWLLAGVLVGVLGFIAYRQYLSIRPEPELPVPQPAEPGAKPRTAGGNEPAASSEDDGVLDTDYSFYDVLPTEDTVGQPADGMPESGAMRPPEPAAADAPAAPVAPSASDGNRYLLQAGAFERAADAENLKARIALSGEPARVETAEVNGKTMYRVRLGPYEGSNDADAAKANLAGQGIETVSIKIK